MEINYLDHKFVYLHSQEDYLSKTFDYFNSNFKFTKNTKSINFEPIQGPYGIIGYNSLKSCLTEIFTHEENVDPFIQAIEILWLLDFFQYNGLKKKFEFVMPVIEFLYFLGTITGAITCTSSYQSKCAYSKIYYKQDHYDLSITDNKYSELRITKHNVYVDMREIDKYSQVYNLIKWFCNCAGFHYEYNEITVNTLYKSNGYIEHFDDQISAYDKQSFTDHIDIFKNPIFVMDNNLFYIIIRHNYCIAEEYHNHLRRQYFRNMPPTCAIKFLYDYHDTCKTIKKEIPSNLECHSNEHNIINMMQHSIHDLENKKYYMPRYLNLGKKILVNVRKLYTSVTHIFDA